MPSRAAEHHRLIVDATLGLIAFAALLIFRHSTGSIDQPAFYLLFSALIVLGVRLLLLLSAQGRAVPVRRWIDRLHDDRAAASVSFVLTLPIFLIVVAMIVQLALIVNAALTVNHVAFIGARSAITELPQRGGKRKVRQAVAIALTPISPAGGGGFARGRDDARYIHRTLINSGIYVARRSGTFARRYQYAMAATRVQFNPRNLSHESSAKSVKTAVTYKFMLTVPGAAGLLQPARSRVGGVSGRFWPIYATCTLRSSPGRNSGSGIGDTIGGLFL